MPDLERDHAELDPDIEAEFECALDVMEKAMDLQLAGVPKTTVPGIPALVTRVREWLRNRSTTMTDEELARKARITQKREATEERVRQREQAMRAWKLETTSPQLLAQVGADSRLEPCNG